MFGPKIDLDTLAIAAVESLTSQHNSVEVDRINASAILIGYGEGTPATSSWSIKKLIRENGLYKLLNLSNGRPVYNWDNRADLITPGADNLQYLFFDGAETYASIGQTEPLLADNFTVSLWINTLVGSGSLFVQARSPSQTRLEIELANGLPRVTLANGAGSTRNIYEGQYTLNTGVWRHLCVTVSSYVPTIYVDGSVVTKVRTDSNTDLTAILDLNVETVIGAQAQNYSASYSGALDEVGYYPAALSALDVALIYNAGRGALLSAIDTDTAPTSHWKISTDDVYYLADNISGHNLALNLGNGSFEEG